MINVKSDIFTVKEITIYIKNLINSDRNLKNIWVTGEISNFHLHNSGHMYFSLKDTSTKIDVVMFKSNNKDIKFKIEDGLKVNVHGYIDIYAPRGNYQLYVDKIEPAGKGSLYLAFEQLKEKLEKGGFFSESAKKSIPSLPAKIGVITSPTGAAIRDILSVVRRRFDNVSILIVPSLVQGNKSAEQIVDGIHYLNQRNDIDLIIVSRGGGSIEDLWPFNEEIVARAIFDSKIPVISGVGHETDFTIADFVADLRAPTPSAAAELAIANRLEMEKNINNLKSRLYSLIVNMITNFRHKIKSITEKKIFTDPFHIYAEQAQKLDELNSRLKWNMINSIANYRKKFNTLGGKMETLSPLKTLKRGYSISSLENDSIITSITEVNINDHLLTRVTDGIIYSQITDVKDINKGGEK